MAVKINKTRRRALLAIRKHGLLSGEPFAAVQVQCHGTWLLSLERAGWLRRCDDHEVAQLPFLADTQGGYWAINSEGRAVARAMQDE
jgi:hypothetical protein